MDVSGLAVELAEVRAELRPGETTLAAIGAGQLDRSGIGTVNPAGSDCIAPVTGPRLISDSKPEVLYIGANYCPFCAAQRWAIILALSRFGTFSGRGPSPGADRARAA